MNDLTPKLEALQALGYSGSEARFLYFVATHSGYFVAHQFLAFAGTKWGKRTTHFWTKLQTSKHAQIYRFAQGGTIYHLFSKKIYRQIGHENLRNRREHEYEYIRTRVAMLDFVLSNLGNRYLETEQDKVTYFCSELNISAHHLPSKSYVGRYTARPTIRYFVDRMPMFFRPAPAPQIVNFTYVQATEAHLSGFAHHLQMYLPLFRELSEFRFLFLARSQAYFTKASELFRDLVTIPLESNPADDLLRYFRIRQAWDLAQYASVTEGDLIFRNLARERFSGSRFEHFYRAWKVGRVSEQEIRTEFQGSDRHHSIEFEAQLLTSIAPFHPAPGENR